MADDDPSVAALLAGQMAILRAQVDGLLEACERQNAVIGALIVLVRRLDEQLQLELVHLQPSPADDHDPPA